MAATEFPIPEEGFVITHFLTVADPARAARFYAEVLGGEVLREGEPTFVRLANSWIILNVGGGPTKDKPDVVLAPPADPKKASAFLNIRVADIQRTYRDWSARGARFLTPPQDMGGEFRCYMRDSDGYLIEVGETKPGVLDRS